ncbi:hypothetical protein FOFC_18211 [Fusarium oxysporum]|nr:hypothetical protein FOFC_18211 [Fusarium oxysporum]
MRSTEVRLALLAVIGVMRAITYSFQTTAHSATNVASQLDRFAYTMNASSLSSCSLTCSRRDWYLRIRRIHPPLEVRHPEVGPKNSPQLPIRGCIL